MRWCVLILLGLVNVVNCQNCRGEKPRPRDCDKLCDEHGNCKLRAALLLPKNTTYDACLAAVGPALDLAMQDPVIKDAFPPWLTVEWMKYDVTDCDAAYAVISAIDAYNDCANVFFGPSCDFALGASTPNEQPREAFAARSSSVAARSVWTCLGRGAAAGLSRATFTLTELLRAAIASRGCSFCVDTPNE